MELTKAQWAHLERFFPEEHREPGQRGRPKVSSRAILEGILWILRTGAPWKDLPGRYPPYQTCHRRYQEWVEQGLLDAILQALAQDLEARGQLDLSECFIDGSFASAKKGALVWVKQKRGKGTKLMAITDREGLPVAVSVDSASPHEVRLVEDTLNQRITLGLPDKLVGDKAYDSDPLDAVLAEDYGVEMIAPHKANRKKPKTQDGRKLRCYKRRWKVERLFAWLHNFRRLVVRYEYKLANYAGFVKLGIMRILLKHF